MARLGWLAAIVILLSVGWYGWDDSTTTSSNSRDDEPVAPANPTSDLASESRDATAAPSDTPELPPIVDTDEADPSRETALPPGTLEAWQGQVEGTAPKRALALTLAYLDGVARDRKLALRIAADLGQIFGDHPELFALASKALDDPHSANTQQCLLSALRRGVIDDRVPELDRHYRRVAADPADRDLWIYVHHNAGGIGDRTGTRAILREALRGETDLAVALGFASIRAAVSAEETSSRARATRNGQPFDAAEYRRWKQEVIDLGVARVEAGGVPREAVYTFLNWLEETEDADALEAASRVRELAGLRPRES